MSRIHVDNIFDKEGSGAPTLPAGVNITGVATATTFEGQSTDVKAGSALETAINAKTSPGKAIALSMVFG